MTKTQALYEFYSQFGIPAFPTNSVDSKEEGNSRITYEPIVSNWYGQQTTSPYLNVWLKTSSESEINALCDRITKTIGSGVRLKCDDGLIVINFSGVWQPAETGDIALKRRFTTLSIDYFTL